MKSLSAVLLPALLLLGSVSTVSAQEKTQEKAEAPEVQPAPLPGQITESELGEMLAAIGLACDDDSGWHMRDPDRAFRLVHVLPAGARRAERIDLQVGRVDFNLDRVIHHRRYINRRKAGLPPSV